MTVSPELPSTDPKAANPPSGASPVDGNASDEPSVAPPSAVDPSGQRDEASGLSDDHDVSSGSDDVEAVATDKVARDASTADDAPGESVVSSVASVAGAAGGVSLVAGLVWWAAVQSTSPEVLALLIVGAVLVAIYAIVNSRDLLVWAGSRGAQRGSVATVQSVAVIGLLVVINWTANNFGGQIDLTDARRYTLADQTQKVLSQLDRDVKVVAFFPSRQEDPFTRGTKSLLNQYQKASPRITIEFVDPDINPGAAKQYDIKNYPITIFTSGDRKEETTGLTEQDFTSALLKLSRTEKKKVYFLQGHQERDPDSSQPTGFNTISQALKRENYVVEKLSFLTSPQVPADAAVLVIAGARARALENEVKAVADFLDAGGHVLALLEPKQETGYEAIFEKWNITVGNDLVIDPSRNYNGDPLTPAPLPQPGHRITGSLTDVLMPGSRTITPKSAAGTDLAIASLLKTTERGWGETTMAGQAKYDEGVDVKGPVSVAVAVNRSDPTAPVTPGATPTPGTTPKVPKGRIVVVGNTEFASNTLAAPVLGNRDFFVNSVNWLAEEEDLISIRAEPQSAATVVMTNQSQVLVFFTTVVLVPVSALLIGIAIWWQRR